jgi:hypothetical protein
MQQFIEGHWYLMENSQDKMCPRHWGDCFLVHGTDRDDLYEAFGGADLSRRSLSMYVSAICTDGSYPVLSISPTHPNELHEGW